MADNKRPTQTKYLKINDYLLYKDIEEENWFFSDEMSKFLKEHDLPTPDELSKYNLRVYVDNSVQIHIYNMNEIKNVNINLH
jgi:hypothetical protein